MLSFSVINLAIFLGYLERKILHSTLISKKNRIAVEKLYSTNSVKISHAWDLNTNNAAKLLMNLISYSNPSASHGHAMSYHAVLCHDVPYCDVIYILRCITWSWSCHVMSCHVMSCHVMLCLDVPCCDVIYILKCVTWSCHVMSCCAVP